MLATLETIIAFLVIMIVLTHAVKGITSLIKANFDYFSRNLKWEVNRLLKSAGRELGEAAQEKLKWEVMEGYNWERLGGEFLTVDNVSLLARKVGIPLGALPDLEARLAVHRANVDFAWEKLNKRITLVVGFALCLALNINAVTLWNQLHHDQKLRNRFVDPAAQVEVINNAAKLEQAVKAFEKSTRDEVDSDGQKTNKGEKLRDAYDGLLAQSKVYGDWLETEMSFGAGRIWTLEKPTRKDFFKALLGSVLTAILLSIGAPYWHDLLKLFTSLRQRLAPGGAREPAP